MSHANTTKVVGVCLSKHALLPAEAFSHLIYYIEFVIHYPLLLNTFVVVAVVAIVVYGSSNISSIVTVSLTLCCLCRDDTEK